MNKQELIKKYKRLEGVWDAPGAETARQIFLQDLEQLDEPEKVTIPQFVADVIEDAREKSPELEDALHYTWGNGTKKFTEWYNKKSNRDIFARAWLDGYEVEKEKRYSVKIRGEIKENLLVYGLGINRYFFARTYDSTKRNEHTREQLEKAGFEWVFDCQGIEIKEVE